MLNYSNGWGHLVVTVCVLAMCTFLLYFGKLDSSAIAGLLGSVISFWFMSGSVNRFAAATTPSSSSTITTTTATTGQQSQGATLP